ncbi:uncharacterized protein LY89DRAFT_692011 [Mollisia scopiformis]|uniref:Uncharacterized protein n=1 Tax=Mollisia scopiformis TaxID=149040 RepID=A0A132B5H1_MOLSC|nr:uncharacterized protein LY89DRAFT_692011 [Mollisia scopiformis]KUJ06917.1 hypothetical protein LY89DRAFT_692011 [Mollisia scopiformis]
MSVATATSLRVIAVSIDGSLGGPIRNPLRSVGGAMMGRFLEDRQRYDAIACGVPTILKEISPKQDIESTLKTLRTLAPQASGTSAKRNEQRDGGDSGVDGGFQRPSYSRCGGGQS